LEGALAPGTTDNSSLFSAVLSIDNHCISSSRKLEGKTTCYKETCALHETALMTVSVAVAVATAAVVVVVTAVSMFSQGLELKMFAALHAST